MLIKNFEKLNTTPERKVVLEFIETALASIQPQQVMQENFKLENNILTIQNKTFDLKNYERVSLLGFGKGSAGISRYIESVLGDKLSEGYVIDTVETQFQKIEFTLGTHPLPSQVNFEFTQKVLDKLANRTEKDLVLVVICGGGSAMLVAPHSITLKQKIAVNKALLESGANIIEMNKVRKHLSKVKGGQLAKHLYPATVASLIFSDVPGNDLSFIASGPTVLDTTTGNDATELIVRYKILEKVNISKDAFCQTPKEEKYFEKVSNILMLSNLTALHAMEKKAKEAGFTAKIYSDKFQSDAKEAGKKLINETPHNTVLLAGGETTVHVTGNGKGGRNQEVVLGALENIDSTTTIASFDSDGWDYDVLAGAIGDMETVNKAKELNLNINEFLSNNNSLPFFQKVGDGIDTGRLPSNVSDLFIVLKK